MIRVLKVTTISKKYLRFFHERHPEVTGMTYENHLRAFENDSYAEVGLWKLNLERLGSYVVLDCYIDYGLLQRKWMEANGIAVPGDGLKGILEAQIEFFKPDIVFEDDAAYLNPAWREELRRKFPCIKHFVAWDGYIRSDIARFRGCRLIFTCVEVIRNRYLEQGFECAVLPFGFEPDILSRISEKHSYDATFVGNIIPEIHRYRMTVLYELFRTCQLEVWISNFSDKLRDWKKRINYYRQSEIFNWGKIREFERASRGEAYGLEMYGILHSSRVTCNIHGDGVDQAGNMRLIEACGSGACLLCDDKPNISEYFIPDEEIVTFKSVSEARSKVQFLLANERERARIAKNAQEKVFREFSFLKRVSRFDEFLQARL